MVETITLDPPADLKGIYSFDFSPDDTKLYVTARADDIIDDDPDNKLEIFSIDRATGCQRRITNNRIPDYYPSTLDLKEYLLKCEPFEGVIKFGEKIYVGTTVSGENLDFIVEQFQWGSGEWTTNGFVEIDEDNHPNGSGRSLRVNNVNLNFQHNFPATQIKLKFADLGGNSNIKVNGEFRNLSHLVDINGEVLGGVNITVNADQTGSNWVGSIILTGEITGFSIGGQEFYIDDYCYLAE